MHRDRLFEDCFAPANVTANDNYEPDQGFQPRRSLQWAFLFLIIFCIIYFRAPQVFTEPALQVEDGSHIFAHFWQKRIPSEILRFKAGYIPLTANLIGYVSVRLPTLYIPYALTWTPLAIAIATYILFFSTRYRSVIASDLLRYLSCILFALAPFGSMHHAANTDYSIWNTLLLLILLVIVPLPGQGLWRYGYWAVLNLLVWSHPLSIVALPLLIWHWFRDKANRPLYLLACVNIVAYQILGVQGAGSLTGHGVMDTVTKLVSAALYSGLVDIKVLFRSAFGQPLFGWVDKNMPMMFIYWFMLVLGATTIVFRRWPESRKVILGAACMICVMSFLNIVGRGYYIGGDLSGSPRYGYIQSMFCVVIYVIVVFALLGGFDRKREISTEPTTHVVNRPVFMTYIILLVHYTALNFQYGYYSPISGLQTTTYTYAHPDNGPIVRRFFRDLADAERAAGNRVGIYLTAQKINDWPIVIDTRSKK